ncbi:MAG: TIGR02757 family protein [Candidatus Wallbacteria bacterium]
MNNTINGEELKKVLDFYLQKFNYEERLKNDPVYFPHQYSSTQDIEAAAFIASSFAYGKVSLFFGVIKIILDSFNPRLCESLTKFNAKKDMAKLKGASYRFNKTEDIAVFLEAAGRFFRECGSISRFLESNYGETDATIMNTASLFVKKMLAYCEAVSLERFGKPLTAGVRQLLPDPENDSTCKRLCMFLRWLTRGPDAIDFGILKNIPKSKLVIPLDTHIARLSKMLGLTSRKDQSLKTAIEITQNLAKFEPGDPLKYDFALCHIGISGLCQKGEEGKNCINCPLNGICLRETS